MEASESVMAFIATFLKIPRDTISLEKNLDELVRESFLLIQMIVELQETFHIHLVHNDLAKVKTLADLVAVVSAKKQD